MRKRATGLAAVLLLLATGAHATRKVLDSFGLPSRAGKACPASCLTCDASGACTSCPARHGLDTAANPRLCKPCADEFCIDCHRDLKKCERCILTSKGEAFKYLAWNHTCQQCTYYEGPCDLSGCNPHGSCKRCSSLGDYVRIQGQCTLPPQGCDPAQTRPDGSCTACREGYVKLPNGSCQPCKVENCGTCTAQGTCERCLPRHALQRGKCVPCAVSDCEECSGNAGTCKKCFKGAGGVNEDGKCVPCRDKGCHDCSSDYRGRCRNCRPQFYLKDGKRLKCRGGCYDCPTLDGCAWGTGVDAPSSCDSQGYCNVCTFGYGRVDKLCEQCRVKHCFRCDRNTARCTECGYDGTGRATFPNAAGTACLPGCKVKHCAGCTTRGGACTRCEGGYGLARDGTCHKCLVAHCRDCGGDASSCRQCRGEDCKAGKRWDWDPRTKTCVEFGWLRCVH